MQFGNLIIDRHPPSVDPRYNYRGAPEEAFIEFQRMRTISHYTLNHDGIKLFRLHRYHINIKYNGNAQVVTFWIFYTSVGIHTFKVL